MLTLKPKCIFVLGSLLYACLSYTQKVSFSVKEMPFCTSASEEFSPMYFQNGLVFCSNSLSNTSIQSEGEKLFNILTVQKRDSVNWKSPELFSKELTTILNEGPVTFKPNGEVVFYARNNMIEGKFKTINSPSNTMGIFSSEYINGTWTNIEPFPYNSLEYSLGTPALSPNGLRIYFASDMPGGEGGTDLYYSDYFSGKWQTPVNLGKTVNTAGNESYPFIAEGGQLFFASDGLPGMGGKDIFYTVNINGEWQPPIHLGANINSEHDDYGLITDVNFEEGYFSSNRKHSGDIFSFKSEMPQFGYCDTIRPLSECFVFYDDRFTDTLHLTYEWNFGKGIIKHGYQVEHCFDKPGNYEVVLTIVHNLADSVFETKAIHRFTLENPKPVFIVSETPGIKGYDIQFNALFENFREFEVQQSYWNFGEGFLQTGSVANNNYTESGSVKVSFGLEGSADTYGRVPRTCYTKQVKIASDYQELSTEYKNRTNYNYNKEELIALANEMPLDKNGLESFRTEFIVLSQNLPLLNIDNLEDSLKKINKEYFQVLNNEFSTATSKKLNKLVRILKEYPNEQITIAIHKNKKGSSKSALESTELLAAKLEQYLLSQGKILIINSIAYGDTRPAVSNKEKYARYLNQRIEFIIHSVSREEEDNKRENIGEK